MPVNPLHPVVAALEESFQAEHGNFTGDRQILVTALLERIKARLSHGEMRACIIRAEWGDVLTEYFSTQKLYVDRIKQLEAELKEARSSR